jgi:hypothetical protein
MERRLAGSVAKRRAGEQCDPTALSVVPLNEPGAELDVHVAWRARESSVAILAFLKTVRYIFRTERGSARQDKNSPVRRG